MTVNNRTYPPHIPLGSQSVICVENTSSVLVTDFNRESNLILHHRELDGAAFDELALALAVYFDLQPNHGIFFELQKFGEYAKELQVVERGMAELQDFQYQLNQRDRKHQTEDHSKISDALDQIWWDVALAQKASSEDKSIKLRLLSADYICPQSSEAHADKLNRFLAWYTGVAGCVKIDRKFVDLALGDACKQEGREMAEILGNDPLDHYARAPNKIKMFLSADL